MANSLRYSYLRDAVGQFRNPYDHGCRKNCSDFLVKGYNEDVELVEDSADSLGIGMVDVGRNSTLQEGDTSHLTNGNGYVSVDMDDQNAQPQHAHNYVHSSRCSHSSNEGRSTNGENSAVGLSISLGRNSSSPVVSY